MLSMQKLFGDASPTPWGTTYELFSPEDINRAMNEYYNYR